MMGDSSTSSEDAWQQRVIELFNAAVELPAAERAGFLTRACGSDCDLRAELDSLLACDAAAAVLERPALRSMDVAALCEPLPGPLPDHIGAYEILGLIGVGGMGVVYRARQKSPARIVALKLIRPDITSHESRRRFATEMETLALLRHPGIATIHDAGTVVTPNGAQPYIAMEYVDGQPLLTFAVEHGLDQRARVELLARVCDAIGHAHQRGVIHRDIKPANILVERVDGTPQPRVIDFGVARMVGRDRRATAVTVQGQVLGTLSYMSPEQVDGDPRAIDTRSDVYSLGVLGYQLLSGKLPIEVPESSFYAAARVVHEQPPCPLGARDRSLRGDLNTIVLKALAKNPDERYESAVALAADLRRHLAGEPIVGQPPSSWYLLQRYVARHRVIVGAAGVALLGLVVGLAGTSYGLVRARQSAAALESQARQTIDAATFLLERVAKDLDPVAGTASVRHALLERLDAQLDELLPRAPNDEQLLAARAAVWARQAELLISYKQFDEALALRQRVLELRRRLLASAPQSAMRGAEVSLTLVQIGDVLNGLAEFDEARQWWEEALAMDAELVRNNPGVRRHLDDVAWGHDRLANLALREGRLDEAEEHCGRRVEITEQLLRIEPGNLITYYGMWQVQQTLCSLQHARISTLSEPQAVSECRERAKAAARAALEAAQVAVAGDPHNRRYLTAQACSLSQVASESCEASPDEATRLYAAALRINDQLAELDPDDRPAQQQLHHALWNCGTFAADRGEYRRAVYFLERLLDMRKTGRWPEGDPEFGPVQPVEDLLRVVQGKLDAEGPVLAPDAEGMR